MPAKIYWQHNDNLITLEGLKNQATGAYINNATVTCRFMSPMMEDLSGMLTMTYVDASNGDYRATLPYDLSCTCQRTHTAMVVADAGAGLRGQWEVPVLVEPRTLT